MSKYDNIIYLAICEASVEFYHKTNFSNYQEYCKGIARSLNIGSVNSREKMDILTIINSLDKVFSMSSEENGRYLSQYFNLPSNKHAEFQEVVLTTRRLFPDIPNPRRLV
jgi:hypothetical protein